MIESSFYKRRRSPSFTGCSLCSTSSSSFSLVPSVVCLSVQVMDQTDQHHPSVSYKLFKNANPQDQSFLFSLPGEVRDAIYTAALTSYEDARKPYDRNTYWFRPHYFARRRSDYTLLRTCKKVYQEAWFKPWSLADHTFWLTSPDRAPIGTRTFISHHSFGQALQLIQAHYGDVEVERVRFFAQMYMLERGEMDRYLQLAYFHPRSITVTIRHTDWWHWERDEWLHINRSWVDNCKLPLSTQSFQMELETLVRKKDQLESIVEQMKESWFFTRTDGSLLTAKHTATDRSTWRGSSTWAGLRWVRDETDPDCIDYCK